MTAQDEGFARRWARLKTRRAPEPRPGAGPAELEEVPPDLQSLALEEIAPWLKRRVPELWKQAALRRIWLGDPSIRNFIGPADYAWDWNVPGGAPGYGPMRAWDDLAALLDRAIGAPEPAAAPAPEAVASGPSAPLAPPEPTCVPPAARAAEAAPAAARIVPEEPAPVLRRRGGGAVPV